MRKIFFVIVIFMCIYSLAYSQEEETISELYTRYKSLVTQFNDFDTEMIRILSPSSLGRLTGTSSWMSNMTTMILNSDLPLSNEEISDLRWLYTLFRERFTNVHSLARLLFDGNDWKYFNDAAYDQTFILYQGARRL